MEDELVVSFHYSLVREAFPHRLPIGRKKREQKENGYLFPSLMVRLQVQKPTWPNINLPQLSVGDPGENT
jgi:hypothetical protein